MLASARTLLLLIKGKEMRNPAQAHGKMTDPYSFRAKDHLLLPCIFCFL